MKKIVALVLSLVMVLSLSAVAFADITLWAPNNELVKVDIFDGKYNVKTHDAATYYELQFTPAKAPVYNADGTVKEFGNIAFYTIQNVGSYVLVSGIPADADASQYILVKKHNPLVGYNQTSPDAVYYLKAITAAKYSYTATLFTEWSNDCEKYAKPANADTVKYYTCAGISLTDKIAAEAVATDAAPQANVLVGNEVVTLNGLIGTKAPTQHKWVASEWDAKGVVTGFTCAACKTAGKVINASVNAPAGSKIDNVGGVLIAYVTGVTSSTGATVESAQTFDAGIAMYVGMSVMAAAGSAVVLKKKD